MHRTRYLIALVAVLALTIQFVLPTSVGAHSTTALTQSSQTGSGQDPIKNPQQTGCNANNPNGGGCPINSISNGPVCGTGEHLGNPHCVVTESTTSSTTTTTTTTTTVPTTTTTTTTTTETTTTPTTTTTTTTPTTTTATVSGTEVNVGQLKICKSFVGSFPANTTFTFTATGGGVRSSVTFNAPTSETAAVTCLPFPDNFPFSTAVSISETGSTGANAFTNFTTAFGAGVTSTGAHSGTLTTASSGATIIAVTNTFQLPVQLTTLEICKAGTGGLTGTFHFAVSTTNVLMNTSTDIGISGTGTSPGPVNCADVTVPVGSVTVTESSAATNFTVAGCMVSIAGGTATSCGTSGSATFTVGAAASGTAAATITFTNAPAASNVTITCPSVFTVTSANGVTTVQGTATATAAITAITETGNTTNFGALTNTGLGTMSATFSASTSVLPATLEVQISAGGATMVCDPIPYTATRVVGGRATTVASSTIGALVVPSTDHYVSVTNSAGHGTLNVKISLNGQTIVVSGLKAGATRQLDLGFAMTSGNNTVTVTPLGKPGSSAQLLFADTPSA